MLTRATLEQEARRLGAAKFGIGDLALFEGEAPCRDPKMICPKATCIVGFGTPVPKGLYKTMAENAQFYTYTQLGVKALDEEYYEIFLFRMASVIEDEGYDACLQRTTPNLRVKGDKTTNPEVVDTYELRYASPVEPGKPAPDIMIDFGKAAEACGIGRAGRYGKVVNREYGPFMRYAFIVTDAPLETNAPYAENLCEGCEACVKACPAKCIDADRGLDTWSCSVYYRGALGSNPFMTDEFLKDDPDRAKILAGEKRFTADEARAIYPKLKFLPRTQWGYAPCLCGKKCDLACYRHLTGREVRAMSLKEEFVALAKECGADLVGVAPASRFAESDPVFKLLPQVQSVIGIAFRILRGTYRGTEEGTTFYQYTTMAVENMEETVMPIALLRLSNLLEGNGFMACPQRRNQTIMQEEDGTNPEVAYDAISRGRRAENSLDFEATAVTCGLGELGFHGALLTDDFGPFVRYVFILTDAELEADPIVAPHLCDRCGECAKGCPGHAIDATTGTRDDWRCAAYYNGANGLKNPFMPPDAFKDFPDRLKIIAGEAEMDEEKAKKIIDNIWFYPPAQHSYPCSICGRACDTACYCHLEAKGVLKRKFVRPFRSRDEWKFKIEDFA